MPLSPGTRLGHYDVTSLLGEGGMGQVWQATDTQLNRQVALKILPDAFSADPDRLARFQREAQILASLNHPNIAAIHGIEEAEPSTGSGQGAVRALVLELVDGPTLADQIAKGPIPLDEALPIAKQIAEALEAAHEAGVIHRDLKPANIKVRDDGTVKVLDFGLAKALDTTPEGDPSQSPTLTAAATQMGVILGTAAYMSPEQARGKPVDRRADIWAFGCVLYEMLTGQRPFRGEDVSLTLAAVMTFMPDLDRLPGTLSPTLRTYLARCLAKDPKERLRDIGDVRLAMEGAFDLPAPGPVERPETPAAVPREAVWGRAGAMVGVALVAAGVAGLAVWTGIRPDGVPAGLVRFTIAPAATLALGQAGTRQDIAITRDGTQVIYVSRQGPQLIVRPIDQLVGAPLRGSEGGFGPFVSPDGEWVGFTPVRSQSTLQKVSIFGGPPITITEAPASIFGASWGTDDQIIFGTSGGGLFRVPGGGGEPKALTTPDTGQGETSHLWPSIIPGHDAVVFTAGSGDIATGQLRVLDLVTGEATSLGLSGVSPRYVSTGHLVFASVDGSVRAVPFDARSLEVTGSPVPLVEGVGVKPTGAANFSVSDNGRLVYVSGAVDGSQQSLVWVDRAGREESTAAPPRPYSTLSLSPDGTRAALAVQDGGRVDVWVSELARGTLTRVTNDEGFDGNPLWSPDGSRLVFRSDRNGKPEVFWRSADGSGAAELLLTMDASVSDVYPYDWSADGATLFLYATFQETDADIGMVSVDTPGTWAPLIQTAAREWAPTLSPDGRWLAYASDETGRDEVYVQRFPELDGRHPISVGGGYRPTWSDDGRELLYLRAQSGPPDAAMRVSIEVEDGDPPSLRAGTPEPLFEWRYAAGPNRRYYDVSPDGQRFLVIGREDSTGVATPEITVVLNWFQELKERVPVP